MQAKSKQTSLNESKNREVIHPGGDPQVGNLATPINASNWVRIYLNNLPALRQGLTPFRRGLEVGMAHGYWLVGPFVKLGPLRDTAIAVPVGFLCAVVLIVVSTYGLWLYASSNPPIPAATNAPSEFRTAAGWSGYASGFLIGGVGGAFVAWLVLIGVGLFT